MKKILFLLSLITILSGCRVKVHGPYNEVVVVPLADSYNATVNFTKKGGEIAMDMWLYNGDVYKTRYWGGVYWKSKKATYVFHLTQNGFNDNLTKKEKKLYTESDIIKMEVTYFPKQKNYKIRFYDSHFYALNMNHPLEVYPEEDEPKEEKPQTFLGKVIDGIGNGIAFCRDKVNLAFDNTFGNVRFASHWWFLFYLGGLLLIAIGLKIFTPLVWVGVIMQYAYLQYMSPPFFMLWPSIVGWGWTILSVLPIVFIVGFNIAMCLSVVGAAFSDWLAFIILLIPAFISILSLFLLLDITFTDHLELLLFFLLGAGGETYAFIGTFTDGSGNVWDVYMKR